LVGFPPRDYGLVGEALQDDRLRVTAPNPLRAWAALAAVIFVLLAVLSWPNPLYLLGFLFASAALAILAVGLQIYRPVVNRPTSVGSTR